MRCCCGLFFITDNDIKITGQLKEQVVMKTQPNELEQVAKAIGLAGQLETLLKELGICDEVAQHPAIRPDKKFFEKLPMLITDAYQRR